MMNKLPLLVEQPVLYTMLITQRDGPPGPVLSNCMATGKPHECYRIFLKGTDSEATRIML